MVNDSDRALLVAFIHGEMTPIEMQKFSVRIENEAPLRAEFEAYLEASDKIEDLLAQPAKEDFSPEQVKTILAKARMPVRRSRRSLFYAGSAVMAASLALVVFTKLDLSDEALKGPPPEIAEQMTAATEPAPPPAAPPAEAAEVAQTEAAPAELHKSEAVASAAPAAEPEKVSHLERADAKPEAKAIAGMKGSKERAVKKQLARTKEVSADMAMESESDSSNEAMIEHSEDIDMNESEGSTAQMADAPPPPPDLKMGVIASKIQVSKGLNKARALKFLQRQLDGKSSCSNSTEIAAVKNIRVDIHLKKNGSVSKVVTDPESAETANCLKARLKGNPEAFKAKAGGKITIQLKIF